MKTERLSKQPGWIFCSYVNTTNLVEVIRIANIPNWYFERVIFPGQRCFFEAPFNAKMEIHTGNTIGAILSDKILCNHLCID